MSECTPEFWTLKDIRASIEKGYNGNKKIVIPMFQRGKRWDKDKKETFIDSLRKKYPIGTLLFYKDNDIYTLIDGLQRATAIKDYLSMSFSYDCSAFESISALLVSSEGLVNSTGILKAVNDYGNHVDVRPNGYSIEEWKASRANASTNPHPCTVALYNVCTKVLW